MSPFSVLIVAVYYFSGSICISGAAANRRCTGVALGVAAGVAFGSGVPVAFGGGVARSIRPARSVDVPPVRRLRKVPNTVNTAITASPANTIQRLCRMRHQIDCLRGVLS